MRQVSFSLLFDWDGSGGFTFNESNYLDSVSGDEGMTPPGESNFSGNGYISEISIKMLNSDKRFSTTNSGSPIYSYISNGGFLQKAVRLSVTLGGNTHTIFRGFVKSIEEDFRGNKKLDTVTITCRSQDDIFKGLTSSTLSSITKFALLNQLDESEIIKRILEAAGHIDGINFRSQSYIAPTLDKGLFTIPYFWLDKESPIEDAWMLAAACSGRFYYDSETGLFYYKNAFEFGKGVGGTSQATLDEGNCEGFSFNSLDNDLIESVTVTSRGRFISEEKEIWKSDKPIAIRPNETKVIFADISNPVVELGSVTFRITSPAGQSVSGVNVNISIVYSQEVKVTIVNTTDRFLFVRDLLFTGKVLEPIDNVEYKRTSNNAFWTSRNGSDKTITTNAYVQTLAQAKAIGDLALERQSQFSTKLNVKKYRGNSFLRVGMRVTVSVPGKISQQFIITSVKWGLSASGFYQDLEVTSASGIYGLSNSDYFIIGTHSQNSNKRLFY